MIDKITTKKDGGLYATIYRETIRDKGFKFRRNSIVRYNLEDGLRSFVNYRGRIDNTNPILRHLIEDPLWVSALCLHLPFLFALDPINGTNLLQKFIDEHAEFKGVRVKVPLNAEQVGLFCLESSTFFMCIHAFVGCVVLNIMPLST